AERHETVVYTWQADALRLAARAPDADREALRAVPDLLVRAVRLRDQARHDQAGALLEDGVARLTRVLGEAHPYVSVLQVRLADSLEAGGQHVRAQPLYEKALATCEAALGRDHPVTAARAHDLAHSLHLQGRFAQAQPLYE